MLAINLDQETEDRLENLAKNTNRTKTFYVREAILAYLDDLEDVYLAQVSLRDLASGKSNTITLDDMEMRLEKCGQ